MMRIENEFIAPATPDEAWELLTDLARVAPCLPGATVESVEGDVLNGNVALRVGPMTMRYAGEARFTFKDDENKVATIQAKGRDGRGGGAVDATIKASLEPAAEGSKVVLATDLNLTGRVAQLGRGPINEVSAKLMVQFADCLAATFDAEETSPTDAPPPVAAEAIDLLDRSVLPTRTIAIGAGGLIAVVMLIIGRRWWRRRRG